MRGILIILVVALVSGPAAAQPVAPANTGFALPSESVTVTVTRPSETAIKNFVETRAAPTRNLDKMARWNRKICPLTVGLGITYAKYVTQRIRDIATAVGAPVNSDPGCRPNIQVVFTTAPQAFMDLVRKSGSAFLGYYNNSSQADDLAKVTHPIQAWYMTESLDYDGVAQVDRGICRNDTVMNTLPIEMTSDLAQGLQGPIQLNLPCATIMHASGSRLSNGHDSAFFNALILGEPAKLLKYEVGTLADYVAMLALSQPASLDSCLELPSISNLLAAGSASASTHITDGDLAYLRALYKMPSGRSLGMQESELRFQMNKTLVIDKGGAN